MGGMLQGLVRTGDVNGVPNFELPARGPGHKFYNMFQPPIQQSSQPQQSQKESTERVGPLRISGPIELVKSITPIINQYVGNKRTSSNQTGDAPAQSDKELLKISSSLNSKKSARSAVKDFNLNDRRK